MPNFEVRVRLFDVQEADAWSARQEVETRLRASGFRRWQIVGLRVQDAPMPPRVGVPRMATSGRPVSRRRRSDAGLSAALLLAAVLAWTLLFWWQLF